MSADATIHKYLATYAEAVARIPLPLPTDYAHVLVMPVLGEPESCLDGVRHALQGDGSGLLVLVVNATSETPAAMLAQNQVLLVALQARAQAKQLLHDDPPIHWLRLEGSDTIVVDRTSPGHRLPTGQGVGLARKLGADLALALKVRGLVRATGFGSTDADAVLPASYFHAGERAVEAASAAVFPFQHEPSSEPMLRHATALYELTLRYYVLGLAYAGSSYAYHSLGSTLYVRFDAYTQVRGFPRRQAGEDFYLLDKLVKLGAIERLAAPVISIQSRLSSRVPFGTGPGVKRLLDLEAGPDGLSLYSPRSFEVLREVLTSLMEFAESRDLERTLQKLAELPEGEAVLAYLGALDIATALPKAAQQAKQSHQLARRLCVWFDALRSLRLIHALRDQCHSAVPWRQALAEAPFLRLEATSAESALSQLRRAELGLSPRVGTLREAWS